MLVIGHAAALLGTVDFVDPDCNIGAKLLNEMVGYYRDDNKLIIAHAQAYRADEDPKQLIAAVGELCRRFSVRWIGADGRGNGLTINRLLLDQLAYKAHLYGIVYSEHDQKPVPD